MPRTGRDHAEGWHASSNLIKRTLDPWSILQRVTQRLHRDSQSAKQLQRSGFSIFTWSAQDNQLFWNRFEKRVKWLGIITKPDTCSTYPIKTKFNFTIYVRRLLSPPALEQFPIGLYFCRLPCTSHSACLLPNMQRRWEWLSRRGNRASLQLPRGERIQNGYIQAATTLNLESSVQWGLLAIYVVCWLCTGSCHMFHRIVSSQDWDVHLYLGPDLSLWCLKVNIERWRCWFSLW